MSTNTVRLDPSDNVVTALKALETGATDKAKAQMGLGIALADQDKMAEAKQAFGQIAGGNRASLAKAWIAYTDMKTS